MMRAGQAVRVLLCDHQGLVRAGLRAVLGAHSGIEIVGEAADAQDALDQVEGQRPDVILMDLEMPGLAAVEATRRLSRGHPHLAVIMLTTAAVDHLAAR